MKPNLFYASSMEDRKGNYLYLPDSSTLKGARQGIDEAFKIRNRRDWDWRIRKYQVVSRDALGAVEEAKLLATWSSVGGYEPVD